MSKPDHDIAEPNIKSMTWEWFSSLKEIKDREEAADKIHGLAMHVLKKIS